jgi:murein DD-endopeptidase MepM/ murein hydrolase activator NlpD
LAIVEAPPDLAPLAPLPALVAETVQRGPVFPVRVGVPLDVLGLATVAELGERFRPHFPVRGPFNWGQGAAKFAASRGGRSHEGQDVMSREGTPVVAVRDSVVLEDGNNGGRGNYVAFYDVRARKTYVYMHLQFPVKLRKGTPVKAGQRLGRVGCTGSCEGPHLHFEIRDGRGLVDNRAHDPRPSLSRWAHADDIPANLPPGAG